VWSGECTPTSPLHPQAPTCCKAHGSDPPRPCQAAAVYPEKAKHQACPQPHSPSSKGVPSGLEEGRSRAERYPGQPSSDPPPPPGPPPAPPTHPKMTAFHTMMLFSEGAPLTPAGGSSCSLQGTARAEAPAPPPPYSPPHSRGRPCALRVTQAGSYTPLRKQRNPQAGSVDRRYAISGARPTPPPCCAAPLLPR